MIAPKMIGLVRSPFGYALWNAVAHNGQDPDERYIRATDAEYLLSIVDLLLASSGETLDEDNQGLLAQIRADLNTSRRGK